MKCVLNNNKLCWQGHYAVRVTGLLICTLIENDIICEINPAQARSYLPSEIHSFCTTHVKELTPWSLFQTPGEQSWMQKLYLTLGACRSFLSEVKLLHCLWCESRYIYTVFSPTEAGLHIQVTTQRSAREGGRTLLCPASLHSPVWCCWSWKIKLILASHHSLSSMHDTWKYSGSGCPTVLSIKVISLSLRFWCLLKGIPCMLGFVPQNHHTCQLICDFWWLVEIVSKALHIKVYVVEVFWGP